MTKWFSTNFLEQSKIPTTPFDIWTIIHFIVGIIVPISIAMLFTWSDITVVFVAIFLCVIYEPFEHLILRRLSGAGGRERIVNILTDVSACTVGVIIYQAMHFYGIWIF